MIPAGILLISSGCAPDRGAAPAGAGLLADIPALDARRHVFDNGLTLLVREDRSAPVVSAQAWCSSGSIHEGKWLGAGLSHILEHMLFKGTETRGVAEIAQAVQAIGGRMNAYTSFDRTVFFIDAPSSGWRTCIDILADAMFNATLPEDEYVKEQEVIRREFAMGFDDPGRMSFQSLFAQAFAVHPMRHPVIGHLDVFNRLARQDVLDYYRARYAPNNLTFVVVGDVRFDDVRDALAQLIKDEKRQPLPDIFIPAEPRQLGRRELHAPFATERTHIRMGFHIPPITHPDLYPLDVLGTLLGDGRSSRLHRRIVERDRLAESVDAFAFTPSENGLFVISAVCDPDKRDQVVAAALDEIARLGREGPTPAELEKAKRQALGGRLDELQTMSGQASEIGTAWFVARNLDFADEYLERLGAVTAPDVTRVIRDHFREDNLTVISLNPREAKPGAAEAVAPETRAEEAISTEQLANGARLMVRRNAKVPLASIRVVFRSGVLQEDPTKNGISRLAAACLLKGTSARTAEQIASEIEDLGGSIETAGAYNSALVAVDVLSRDLGRGMEIASDILLNPSFPPDEVDKEKDKQLKAIQAERDQVMAVCRNLLRKNFYGDAHPYAMNPLGREDTLRAIGPEDLRAFHRALCAGSNTVIAVFGDVDPAAVRKMARDHFGAMPRGDAPPIPRIDPPAPATQPRRAEETMDKSQAVIQIGFPGVAIDSPDRFAMEVLTEALADMGSRLFIRIREEQGLAYFVGAAQSIGLIPGHFVLYAGTSPEKADAVVTDLLAEAAKLRESGLTEEEIARAKTKLIAAQQMAKQKNGNHAYAVALDELYGLGAGFEQAYADRIRAVTPAQVAEVARRHLLEDRCVIAIVRPPR